MRYTVEMTVMGWYRVSVDAASVEEAEETAREALDDRIREGLAVSELDNIEFDLEPQVYAEGGEEDEGS